MTEEEEEQDEEERKEPDAPDAPAREVEVEETEEEEEEEENEELPMPRLRTKSLECVVCGRPGSPAKIVVPIIHIGNGPALKVCKKAHLRDSNERKAVLAAIREQIEEAREEAVEEEEEDADQRRCHGYGRLGAEGSRCGARVGQGGPLLWVLKSHRETLRLYFCTPAHLCNYIDQEYRLPPRNNGKKEKEEKENKEKEKEKEDKEETDVETGDEGN